MKLQRLITIPLALLVIAFAIANRRAVPLSFDPFSLDAPALTVAVPLWLIAFGAFVAGILLGGMTAWTTHLYRHLRRNGARRAMARADKAAAKARADDPLTDLPAITPRVQPPVRRTLLGRLTKNRAA